MAAVTASRRPARELWPNMYVVASASASIGLRDEDEDDASCEHSGHVCDRAADAFDPYEDLPDFDDVCRKEQAATRSGPARSGDLDEYDDDDGWHY